jgi:hypothetical protein
MIPDLVNRHAYTPAMTDSRPDTVASVEVLLEALADLRRATRATETVARRALKRARAGHDLASSLAAARPAANRLAMNDALKAVEAARHEIRLNVFAEGLRQGMTIGELGRSYGFSRQLAARYAKEARARG